MNSVLQDYIEKIVNVDISIAYDIKYVRSKPWVFDTDEAVDWVQQKCESTSYNVHGVGISPVWRLAWGIAREVLFLSTSGYSWELQQELQLDYWRAICISAKTGGHEALTQTVLAAVRSIGTVKSWGNHDEKY